MFLPKNAENTIDRTYEQLGRFKKDRNYDLLLPFRKKQFRFMTDIMKKRDLKNLTLTGFTEGKKSRGNSE